MYVSLRSQKVQMPDGTMERREPGDPIPEAANWPDPDRWVRQGRIAKVVDPHKRGRAKTTKALSAPGLELEVAPTLPGAVVPFASMEPADAAPASVVVDHDALNKLTKAQLIELAKTHGLILDESHLKNTLIAILLKAMAQGS